MPIATHVIRRGSYYSWRRKSGGIVIQLSLGTSCPKAARRIAVLITAASEGVWDDMIGQKITQEQAIAAIRGSMMGGGLLAAAVGQPALQSVENEKQEAAGVDPSVTAVAARLTAVQLRTGAANAESCESIRKCAALVIDRAITASGIISDPKLARRVFECARNPEKEHTVPEMVYTEGVLIRLMEVRRSSK